MKKQVILNRLSLYFFILLTFGISQACDSSEEDSAPTPKTTPTPLLPTGVAQAGRVIDLGANLNLSSLDSTVYAVRFRFEDTSLVDSLDLVLIYRLTAAVIEDTVSNEVIPYWGPLPQTLYLDQGPLQYDFLYSTTSFYIFAQAQYSIGSLTNYTQDQVFRLVIIPGEALLPARSAGKQLVDFSDYNAVIKHFGLNDRNVPILKIRGQGEVL